MPAAVSRITRAVQKREVQELNEFRSLGSAHSGYQVLERDLFRNGLNEGLKPRFEERQDLFQDFDLMNSGEGIADPLGMSKNNFSHLLVASEECVDRYVTTLRAQVGPFADRHFSLQETLQIQQKSILADLVLYPLNALWSIPFLTFKKSLEAFEKVGWTKANFILEWLPSGIRTRYQKEIESMILNEFIQPSLLLTEIRNNPALKSALGSEAILNLEYQIESLIEQEVKNYSSSQAVVSDLFGSLLTLFVGRFFFHNGGLGILDLGDQIARKMAHDNAASNFFFGKKLGSAFYNVFPAEPTRGQVFLATFAVGFFLTVFSILAGTLSDPLRKKLGLHHNKLNGMVNHIEEKLYLIFRKELKKSVNHSPEKKSVI